MIFDRIKADYELTGRNVAACMTVGRVNWLIAEIDRLRAIEAALPKCNGIKDDKVVCDRAVVPGMRVWRLEWQTTLGEEVTSVSQRLVWLKGKGEPYDAGDLADSREAAELAGENAGP